MNRAFHGRARAPGKVILSGEHAVVQGEAALAMAVDRYVTAEVSASASACDELSLGSLNRTVSCTRDHLRTRAARTREWYGEFEAGTRAIRAVVPEPEDLLWYAVSSRLELFPELPPLSIRIESQLPLGAGMGSSAAAVAALLQSLYVAADVPLPLERLEDCVFDAERMQHGHPSGVDPAVCVRGGLIRFQGKQTEVLQGRPPPMQLVFSGSPESTTGECVEQVRAWHGNTTIWSAFRAVTDGFCRQLETTGADGLDPELWMKHMKQNHALLVEIGVVPERVQRFVEEVERRGGAAKISGAGSIRGQAGGMLLVYWAGEIQPLCDRFGYVSFDVKGGGGGVRTL